MKIGYIWGLATFLELAETLQITGMESGRDIMEITFGCCY